jgi:hypothetical protein
MADDVGADTDTGTAPTLEGLVSLDKLKRQYSDYVGTKRAEIDEQRQARRYYHGAQWTAKEIKTMNDRNQPVVTYNRIARKIDGVVGLVERLRQDPKAFPRTPRQEDGAELGTAILNYALDTNDWRSVSPDVAHMGAVDGIGGVELDLEPGDHGDPDVRLSLVYSDDFYYDPRSVKPDFSDARFQGVAKWLDLEAAVEMFPDKEKQIRDHCSSGSSGGSSANYDDEKEIRWTNVREKRLRLVEHWHKVKGEWHYTFFSGQLRLADGISPFVDEKGKTFCRFIMFSNAIDHDGDRYGFVRNLSPIQDEINKRRSMGLAHLVNRRIITEAGAVDDVERIRKEATRPDGFLEVNPGFRFEFDDTTKLAVASGNFDLLNEAKQEIENFGPNPALIGQGAGVAGSSGRAIALLQQAGIAELGPFILRYRGWKLRVYRAVWNVIHQYWQSERWIRVTDSDDLAQFIQINGLEMGQAGPQLVNALGNLDVDIILDEGPDQINSMADALETLLGAQQKGMPLPPDVILELLSIPNSLKKKLLEKVAQAQRPPPPDPALEMAKKLELENKAADTGAKQAKAAKDTADAMQTALETNLAAAPFNALAPLGGVEQGLVGPGVIASPGGPPGPPPMMPFP